jgi:L-lactate dehydrogenase complex protein LldG
VTAAREEILGRVRFALPDRRGAGPVDVPRGYRTASELAPGEIVDRFAERVADYRATVRRTDDSGEIAAAVAQAFADHGAQRLLTAGGVLAGWRPHGLDLPEDDGTATAHELDAHDGVLTGAALAIAETGTIVLDGAERSGRRALSLVCDLHVCVVEVAQIVATVPEAIAALEPAARAGRPITFVSGPSATSDIELKRVEGVHGPRRLEVVIAP